VFAVPPGYSGLRGAAYGVTSLVTRRVDVECCAFRDGALPPAATADDGRFLRGIRGNVFIAPSIRDRCERSLG